MKLLVSVFAAIYIALTNGATAPASAQERTLAIRNATILTATSPAAIERGTILVRGGKIAAVGANVTMPADAQVIDATGHVGDARHHRLALAPWRLRMAIG